MSGAKILVVEDERIVAKDLQVTLTRLGYQVPSVVSSGEEAVQLADTLRPDLVLMDIVLKGRIDGVNAAQLIRERFDIPVIFLTAYADDATFQRAKSTMPASYLFKPFKERELSIAIELALHGHTMRKRLQQEEQEFVDNLGFTGDAVIVTDNRSVVTFMSPRAELLTGWKLEEAFGHKAVDVCRLLSSSTHYPIEHPVSKVLEQHAPVELANHEALLVARDGAKMPVIDGATPIKNDHGEIIRVILVLRTVTDRAPVSSHIL